jgi:DNA-binding CsgD family transcriptional regulator
MTWIASLSDREHEVARLVQDRLTNRQIAERLVLSEKTVERHLSRIFVKLDARSRVEVAPYARIRDAPSATHVVSPETRPPLRLRRRLTPVRRATESAATLVAAIAR